MVENILNQQNKNMKHIKEKIIIFFKARPFGVLLLSIFHIFILPLLIIFFIYSFVSIEINHSVYSRSINYYPILYSNVITFIVVVFIGLGLYWGKSWAWWAGLIFYFKKMLSSVLILSEISEMIGSFRLSMFTVIPLLGSLVLIIYFLKGNVRQYYKTDKYSYKFVLLILFAVLLIKVI